MPTLALLVVGACNRQAQVNYRITVTVDDAGSTHSGTGVWSHAIRGGGFPNAYTSRFAGEAVTVALGGKGQLFVLPIGRMRDGSPGLVDDVELYGRQLFGEVARLDRGVPRKGLTPEEEVRELATMVGQRRTIDCARPPSDRPSCPFMVRFADPANPLTVRAVDPGNLAASFGPGTRLQSFTIEITRDPVDFGLRRRLLWLSSVVERRLDRSYGGSTHPNLAQRLSHGDFSRGSPDRTPPG